MDCETFDSSLLDALYGELSDPASAAMDEHIAGCESCSSRIARFKKTQELIGPALELPFPSGLEDRILAAATAAMDSKAAPAVVAEASNVVSLAERAAAKAEPRPSSRQKSGVIAFLSRPQFTVAAAFVLVLGAAALYASNNKRGDMAARSSVADQPPSVTAAANEEQSGAPPSPIAAATATAMASAAGGSEGALALRDVSPAAAPPPRPAAHAGGRFAPNDDDRGGGSVAGGGGKGGPGSSFATASNAVTNPAFGEAKTLYDSGRVAEALPKFEALSPSSPEAELYVARCLVVTQGCDAAAPRYASAGQRSAGITNVATREAARCKASAAKLKATTTTPPATPAATTTAPAVQAAPPNAVDAK